MINLSWISRIYLLLVMVLATSDSASGVGESSGLILLQVAASSDNGDDEAGGRGCGKKAIKKVHPVPNCIDVAVHDGRVPVPVHWEAVAVVALPRPAAASSDEIMVTLYRCYCLRCYVYGLACFIWVLYFC